MDKLDAILFEAARHADIGAEKDRIWMELMRKRSIQRKLRRYALSAAALAAAFAGGMLAGGFFERGSLPPGVHITVPQTDVLLPQTDGLMHYEFLADADCPSVPAGDGIEAFFPSWLPDGLPPAEADSENSWHSGGEAAWASCALETAGHMPAEFTAGLAAGRMRSCFAYESEGGPLAEIRAVVCLEGGKYLSVSTFGISYEDTLKLIESIQN